MATEAELIAQAKTQIESKLGWGDSRDWTNQDFIALSRKIQDEIHVPLSHVTLKRIWGKVTYKSLPNTFTLNTLVQFIGYEHWRDFKVKNGGDPINGTSQPDVYGQAATNKSSRAGKFVLIIMVLTLLGYLGWIISGKEKQISPNDYSFNATKTQARGVPNSVIFNYEASQAPTDSVIIQQSWDEKRRTKVSKDARVRTLIYYLPGYFQAKLVVDEKIVKEQGILIESNGWLAAMDASPMPVYFKQADFLTKGMMSLPIQRIREQNIALYPQAPLLCYINVQDFGPIYSDDFVFEASLRNDYREGSSVCQKTNIYLLCEGAAIGIPLCNKGCVSDMSLFFSGFNAPGKQTDLSGFGVDFRDFVKIRVVSFNGKANIFLDEKLAYQIDQGIVRAKIIGIDFVFQGTGSVDYVSLSNQKVTFHETF